jgi:hypothetical protein
VSGKPGIPVREGGEEVNALDTEVDRGRHLEWTAVNHHCAVCSGFLVGADDSYICESCGAEWPIDVVDVEAFRGGESGPEHLARAYPAAVLDGTVRGLALVELAEEIATSAHAGQVDKAGAPYINHPRRVVARLIVKRVAQSDIYQAAGWLHDVLEDSPLLAEDLLERRIPVQVVAAVEAVTRRMGEPSDDYYARVRANPLALEIKLADIADNSDPDRLALLEPATAGRLRAKYSHAVEVLRGPE